MAAAPVFSKSEYAYEEIRKRILTDALPGGSTISQEHIAVELGVSTTPVREALKRLAAEGLVVLETHRDARVTELTAQEATHLYEVRQNLDPLAASLAATRRTEADVRAVRETLSRLAPLSGTPDLASLSAHRDFHRAVYRASHNPLLVGVLEGLWDKADRYRHVGLRAHHDSRADVARVRREHKALAEAIIAGDADLAEQVMREHIVGSLGRRAIAALADGPDPASASA
ncbi:Transcriptional regulator, GntR family [Nostocoides japonicum T1-X7]|uniref:Transcriptional regulator, GntR family n=1 Tax=Nostocoides japonicum T1-X7 TaxID=1194083 RepID=A0A077LYA1_9MICO|nr:GntR family transcriptional regulator [Tetrasphaera japonica]CCH78626.1 Transcriptional regulator, GntR family [Tetrasphaera japonica T1-X7]